MSYSKKALCFLLSQYFFPHHTFKLFFRHLRRVELEAKLILAKKSQLANRVARVLKAYHKGSSVGSCKELKYG
jgi:hypothetical protein